MVSYGPHACWKQLYFGPVVLIDFLDIIILNLLEEL